MADDAVPEPIDLAPSDDDDDPEDDFEDPSSIASDDSTRSLDDVQNHDWDDNSLDSNDTLYTYDPVPFVICPDPSGYHSLYDAAVSEYDFMAYFSDEHFLRMKRIDHNNFAFREHDWMRNIECFDTYTVIDNLLHWPRAPNHGAPVDVHGFPMTHHYDYTDTFVPH
eukprot:scaffold84696_cov61-Attheya_sp.AAC.1